MTSINGNVQRFVRSTRLKVIGILAGLMVVAVFSFYTPPVLAAGPNSTQYGPGQPLPSQGALGKTASTPGQHGSVPAVALGGNPYNCIGQTDNPHESGHARGNVSTVARTKCNVNLPYIHVDSTLYRQDCFIFCFWTQVGFNALTLRNESYVQTVPFHTCNGSSKHLYEAVSYHAVQDGAGKFYYTYTAKQATVACG